LKKLHKKLWHHEDAADHEDLLISVIYFIFVKDVSAADNG